MEKNENIDKYFRDKLGGYQQAPPEASWDIISQKLAKKRRKGMLLIFVRIAAGMALVVSAGFGIYLFTRPAGNADVPMAQNNTAHTGENNEVSANTGKALKSAASELPEPADAITAGQSIPGTGDKGSAHNFGNRALAADRADVVPENGETDGLPVEYTQNRYTEDTYDLYTIKNHNLPAYLNNNIDNALNIVTGRQASVEPVMSADVALAYASTETPEDEKNKGERWTMGGEAAPLYSYRNISSGRLSPSQLNNLNDAEDGILAYAGGINIAFNAGKRITVQSGFYYSRYGQDKNQVAAISHRYSAIPGSYTSQKSISISNSTGEIVGGIDDQPVMSNQVLSYDFNHFQKLSSSYGLISSNVIDVDVENIDDAVVRQYFDYVELPLIVRYKIIDRRIDFNISGGVVTNFLVGNSVEIRNDGFTSSNLEFETVDISQVNYVGSVGLGIEYPLDGKFAITLEPRFRYYLNPIDKTSVVVHPYSFGIFGGVNYRF